MLGVVAFGFLLQLGGSIILGNKPCMEPGQFFIGGSSNVEKLLLVSMAVWPIFVLSPVLTAWNFQWCAAFLDFSASVSFVANV